MLGGIRNKVYLWGGGVGIEHIVHKSLSLHQISFGTRTPLKKLEKAQEIN